MALTTRSLTNVGDALVDPNGGVLSGAVVTFQLCQPGGRPTDAWDATTGERIGGLKATTTNGSGEFTIALWPNDRGNVRTQYRCTVQWKNYFRDFYGSLPSGSGSYLWVDFFALGEALTPAGISALYDHITDTTVHLSAAQNTFLDALNLPTLTAAEVNYLVGVTSAVQTQLDARALASLLLIAGGGLVGGGNLTNDRAFSVGANADGSIVVNTDDIQVGVLATNAQHGVRGGGTQHATAVAAGAAGFMTGADKTKLDGVTAGAAVASVGATAPITTTGGTTPVIGLSSSAASTLFGRRSGSAGAADEITLGAGLSMTAQVLNTAVIAVLGYLMENFTINAVGPDLSSGLGPWAQSFDGFVNGVLASATDVKTYTASKDTYVDLSTANVITYIAVTNGAGAPAVTANSVRLMKVVTNATDVTSCVHLTEEIQFKKNVRFPIIGVTSPNYTTANDGAPFLPYFAKIDLPSVTYGRQIAICTNEAGGETLVFCDGTNWRRVQDRAVVS